MSSTQQTKPKSRAKKKEVIEDAVFIVAKEQVTAPVAAPIISEPAVASSAPARKPGRPPKNTCNLGNIQTYGIIAEGSEEYKKISQDTIVEFVYDNAKLFKKLFACYEKYGIVFTRWEFLPTCIRLDMLDITETSRVYTEISGNMLISYYCRQPLVAYIRQSVLAEMFKPLDKNIIKFTMRIRRDTARSHMEFIYCGDGSETKEDIPIVSEPNDFKVLPPASADDYPLKFELKAKELKRVVDRSLEKTDTITIQKDGPGNLYIKKENNKGRPTVIVYNDPEKINLFSAIKPDDIFAATIPNIYIKKFAGSHGGEFVTISADKYKDLCIESLIDRKVYTKQTAPNHQETFDGYVCKLRLFTKVKK